MTKDYVTKYHDGQAIAEKFTYILAGFILDYTFQHTKEDDEFIIGLLLSFRKNFAGFYTPTFEGDLRKVSPKIHSFLEQVDDVKSFDVIKTPNKKYQVTEYMGTKNYCDAGYDSNRIIIKIKL